MAHLIEAVRGHSPPRASTLPRPAARSSSTFSARSPSSSATLSANARAPGLTRPTRGGRKGGRKPVVTPDKLARARAHIASGLTVRDAAARVKVGKTALYEALNGSAEAAPR